MQGRYRTKPAEVEAIPVAEVLAADGGARLPERVVLVVTGDAIELRTEHGTVRAAADDWLIRNDDGELYSCKPDLFEATYEGLPDAPSLEDEALERRAW